MAKPTIEYPSARERELAKACGRAMASAPKAVVKARFDARTDVLQLTYRDGTILGLPRTSIPVRLIAMAAPKRLKRIEISPLRDHIWFPDLDEGVSGEYLIDIAFGAAARAFFNRRAAKTVTPSKSRAARENGKKGGRPRVKVH